MYTIHIYIYTYIHVYIYIYKSSQKSSAAYFTMQPCWLSRLGAPARKQKRPSNWLRSCRTTLPTGSRLAHRQSLKDTATAEQHPLPNPNRTRTMPLAKLPERGPKAGCLMQEMGCGRVKRKLDQGGASIIEVDSRGFHVFLPPLHSDKVKITVWGGATSRDAV